MSKSAAVKSSAVKNNVVHLHKNGNLINISHENLYTHPKNLRRFYPEDQVRTMAESIRHEGGVWQALLVVPSEKQGYYYVVDGNVRLAGARLLGKSAPELKCEVISRTEAEQLLAMVITATVRFDPDPVSEALHYKLLMDEQGYKDHEIARAIGRSTVTIQSRLKILRLEEPIQEIIANGALPAGPGCVDALLSIANSEARVKLAKRLAEQGASVKAIVHACERLRQNIDGNGRRITSKESRSAAVLKQLESPEMATKKLQWPTIRQAVGQVCENCDVKTSRLQESVEPAWSMISHARNETCSVCDLRSVSGACRECPVVELLMRLQHMTGEQN